MKSNELKDCPHCGCYPKVQASETAAWITCSNADDPCPSYDTEWTGIQPMRVGGACSAEDAKEMWNELVEAREKSMEVDE